MHFEPLIWPRCFLRPPNSFKVSRDLVLEQTMASKNGFYRGPNPIWSKGPQHKLVTSLRTRSKHWVNGSKIQKKWHHEWKRLRRGRRDCFPAERVLERGMAPGKPIKLGKVCHARYQRFHSCFGKSQKRNQYICKRVEKFNLKPSEKMHEKDCICREKIPSKNQLLLSGKVLHMPYLRITELPTLSYLQEEG